MQSIGERLSEARKRLGWSIREVSEVTKVRGDFLIHFESDDFSFDLPEIYKRGFLKLYTKALKLDTEALLRDFDEIHKFVRNKHTRLSKPFERELLGQIELEDNLDPLTADNVIPTDETSEQDSFIESNHNSKKFLIKIAVLVLIVTAIIGLTVISIRAWRKPTRLNATFDSAQVEPAKMESIKLIALGNVHVVVRQESDRQKLFSGTLTEGQEVVLEKQGQIKIRFSDGEKILLQKADTQYAMNAQGMGVRVFD